MLEQSTNLELLDAWRAGNESAAQVLYQRYMVRLTALARSRLSRKLARRLDPDDIVLSAWRSFFVAVKSGRVFVPDDDNLWPLLVTLTVRKLSRQAARHSSQRRTIERDVSQDEQLDWRQLLSSEPSPEEAAMVVDEVELLLSQLEPSDREVLSRRLQGEQQVEIAAALRCSERTVRRSLQRIRETFLQNQGSIERADFAFVVSASDTSLAPIESQPLLSKETRVQPPHIDYQDILLKKLIGQGAFGKVYQAFQQSTQQVVAVKFLKKQFWNHPRAVSSLLNEVSQASSLSHPHIVSIFGGGRSPHGAPFLVMEWIDGSSLQTIRNNQVFAASDCLRIGSDIADALAAAHAIDVVHGDVTPSNVLLSTDGIPILTDFGFSRSLSQQQQLPLGGTPGYLSPEQVSDAFGPISERTDVYGWGGLMHTLITGSPPWTGIDLPEILARTLSSHNPPPLTPPIGNFPSALLHLIESCLRKEPSERPSSMVEICEILDSL